MILKAPSAYLSELSKEIEERFQLKVDKTRMSRYVAKLGINCMKVISL